MKQGNIRETETCRAVSGVLARVGDKWSVLIVSRLGKQPLRLMGLGVAVLVAAIFVLGMSSRMF